jgi:hypothetical protein
MSKPKKSQTPPEQKSEEAQMFEPDWTGKCEVCGNSPIVPETGMCGPCTFGEGDAADGNW